MCLRLCTFNSYHTCYQVLLKRMEPISPTIVRVHLLPAPAIIGKNHASWQFSEKKNMQLDFFIRELHAFIYLLVIFTFFCQFPCLLFYTFHFIYCL